MLRYAVIGLPDLPANQYLETGSALGPALSALMRATGLSRVEHKLQALRRLARARTDEARRSLLVHVVGTYLALSADEERDLDPIMSDPANREVKARFNIYEERAFNRGIEQGIEQGIARGVEQGIAEGLIQGQRRVLARQISGRFGMIGAETLAKIEAITDSELLDVLAVRILTASSLDELGL